MHYGKVYFGKSAEYRGVQDPLSSKLSPENRWVKLSQAVPWDKFASAYMSMMNKGFGCPGVSPRTVLGALIIKHLENLDDRGVIQAIQENIYMQYFVGLREFTIDPVFDPSLFVEIRKRGGYELFDTLTTDLIRSVREKKDSKHNKKKKKDDGDEPKNKGKMQTDATVADQYITYPTDNGILNESRKKCEKLIDKLYEADGKQGVKPQTYRRTMNSAWLDYPMDGSAVVDMLASRAISESKFNNRNKYDTESEII